MEHTCHNKHGCGNDWSQFAGVGVYNNATMHWCCTQDAIENGYCDSSQQDRLILLDEDSDGNNGQHRSEYDVYHREIRIPKYGNTQTRLHDAQLHRLDGIYVVLLANCNPNGRPVQVTGTFEVPASALPLPSPTPVPAPVLAPSQPTATEGEDIEGGDEVVDMTDLVQVLLDPSDTLVRSFQKVYPEDGVFMSNLNVWSSDSGNEAGSNTVVSVCSRSNRARERARERERERVRSFSGSI